jgi:hypothetical protein
MAKDYKLCPNCNNALDLNANKCPYCGQQIIWLDLSKWLEDLSNWNDIIKNIKWDIEKSINGNKKTSWCLIFIVFFIIIQLIGSIFWFIFEIISSLF